MISEFNLLGVKAPEGHEPQPFRLRVDPVPEMSALTGVESHSSKETTVNPKNVLRRTLKYAATLGTAACVATLALTACSAPSARTVNPPSTHIVSADKPTIVLVHGAFTDASE